MQILVVTYKLDFTTIITQNGVGLANAKIETGWGFVKGTGSTSFVTKAVTFTSTFTDPPLVFITKLGDIVGSDPTSISDLASASGNYAASDSITTTGFNAGCFSRNAANITATTRSGFSWIAIGN